jgi:hypothetical protein
MTMQHDAPVGSAPQDGNTFACDFGNRSTVESSIAGWRCAAAGQSHPQPQALPV